MSPCPDLAGLPLGKVCRIQRTKQPQTFRTRAAPGNPVFDHIDGQIVVRGEIHADHDFPGLVPELVPALGAIILLILFRHVGHPLAIDNVTVIRREFDFHGVFDVFHHGYIISNNRPHCKKNLSILKLFFAPI